MCSIAVDDAEFSATERRITSLKTGHESELVGAELFSVNVNPASVKLVVLFMSMLV